MKTESMIRQLGRIKIEGFPSACIGCGQEHSCSLSGCAVIRATIEKLKEEEEVKEDA